MKQETIEEAAENHHVTFTRDLSYAETRKESFIEGAKWQQEQDKNKYSEEDMREAFEWGVAHITFEEWLKQHKKK